VVPVEHHHGPLAGIEENVVEVQVAMDQRRRRRCELFDDAREVRAQDVDKLDHRRGEISAVPLEERVGVGIVSLLPRPRLAGPALEAFPAAAVRRVETNDPLENELCLLEGATGHRIALPPADVLEKEHSRGGSQEIRRERCTDRAVELLLAFEELGARAALGDEGSLAPIPEPDRSTQHLAGEAEIRADALPRDRGDLSAERLAQLIGSQPVTACNSGGASAWQMATASASAA